MRLNPVKLPSEAGFRAFSDGGVRVVCLVRRCSLDSHQPGCYAKSSSIRLTDLDVYCVHSWKRPLSAMVRPLSVVLRYQPPLRYLLAHRTPYEPHRAWLRCEF